MLASARSRRQCCFLAWLPTLSTFVQGCLADLAKFVAVGVGWGCGLRWLAVCLCVWLAQVASLLPEALVQYSSHVFRNFRFRNV